MRQLLILFLIPLLLGCADSPGPAAQDDAIPQADADAIVPDSVMNESAPADTCRPELLLFGEKDGYRIGLVDLIIEDKGTYYKITKATVYAEAPQWYLNDITIEVAELNATLMSFTKQQLPIDPQSTCFVQELNTSISLKTIGDRKVTLLLGQGQNRAGLKLATASGVLDLNGFVR